MRRNGTKSREKKNHKPSKYRNKKTVLDGILFASKSEAQHYVDLKEMKENGKVIDFQMQVPFELVPTWYPPWSPKKANRGMKYVADFVVQFADGHEEIQDVKGASGYETQTFKDKKKYFEYNYKRQIVIKKVPVKG